MTSSEDDMSSVVYEIDELLLTFIDREPFDEVTDTNESDFGPGVRHRYVISGPENIRLDLDLFERKADGELLLVCSTVHETPEPICTALHKRMRLRSLPGTAAVQVRLARRSEDAKKGWSLHKTSVDELNKLLDADASSLLKKFGAKNLGTRADVLGDETRYRRDCCVLVGDGEIDLLPVVYLITRALPVVRGA